MPDLSHNIERCPHDQENPYSQISRALLQDPDLSFECKGMLVYLLSMKSGWKIGVKQLVNYSKGKTGRDKIYRMLNEAIEFGYMKREDLTEPGTNLRRVTYYLSEFPKFKKCFRRTGFQGVENTDHIIKKKEELLSSSSSLAGDEASPSQLSQMPSAPSKSKGKTSIRQPEERIDITPQAREFVRTFQVYNPFSTLTALAVQKEFNLWLKEKTANNLMEIQKAAAFAFSDEFWIARIQSLKAFKDNFQTILAQSVNLEKRKDKKQRTQCYFKNKSVVEKIKKHFTKQLKDQIFRIKHGDQVNALLEIMDLQAASVVNKETGEKLDLNLRDHKEFRNRFGDMFGIDIGSDI